jgi:hypothetical protein
MTFELQSAQGRAVVLPDVDPGEFQALMRAVAENAVESVKARHKKEDSMLSNAHQSLNILSSQAHGHVSKLDIVREGAHDYVDYNTRIIQEALDRQLTKDEANTLANLIVASRIFAFYPDLYNKLREISDTE